jgi:CrcB protein
VRADVLAAVAVGGMVGSTGRYLLSRAIPHDAGDFPTATFVTNVLGSFVLGVVVMTLTRRDAPSARLLAFLTTGILGSFTTFSTFAVENVVLADDGHLAVAVAYVAASLTVGIGAAWAGVTVARWGDGASTGRSGTR